MPADFHARPTAPVPLTPASARIARPVQKAESRSRPLQLARPPVPELLAPTIESPVGVLATAASLAPRAVAVSAPVPPATPAPLGSALRPQFPRLRFSAIDVVAQAHLAKRTRLWTTIGYVGGVAAVLAAIVSTAGLALGGLIFAPIIDWFRERRARALLNGTAVRVSEQQLPELHSCLVEFSGRLGLKETPALYIVEDNVVNGFAAKIGRKDIVLLTDDMVWGALSAKNPRALGFVLGHELAHVALGHTRTFRSIMRLVVKPLSRLDELSADNVARALVDDDTVAFEGVKILAVGPQLSAYLDDDALIAQANEVVQNKLSKKVEKKMTHPMIMRRVVNILE
jgi:Zn-dependent protease with chaperone function